MKLLSLFSGIGAFEKALANLGIPYELVGYCEIDKWASASYAAIHNASEDMNLGDITKVDEKALPKDIDLITYGFPCQDISLAGKQKGLFNEDGTQTRSGLFFEALRIIEETKPRVAIAENVKNLVGKKFKEQFAIVLASLEAAGYNNYWKVLNAKDYGVPQNRERVFIVSIRKDIDTKKFEFPKGFPLTKRLKDVLEEEVGEKYYLDDSQIQKVKINNPDALAYDKSMLGFENHAREYNDIMPAITAREWKEPRLINQGRLRQIGQIYPARGNPQCGRVYDAEGISPTVDTCGGGNRMPKVAAAMRGRYTLDGIVEQHIEVSDRQEANAITTVQKDSMVAEPMALDEQNGYIRKLTPKECFRLMGFDDEDFAKAEAVNSNTQLYKQAGNSIVVAVVKHLIWELLDCGALYGPVEGTSSFDIEAELKMVEIVATVTDDDVDALKAFFRSRGIPKTNYTIY